MTRHRSTEMPGVERLNSMEIGGAAKRIDLYMKFDEEEDEDDQDDRHSIFHSYLMEEFSMNGMSSALAKSGTIDDDYSPKSSSRVGRPIN